MEKINSVVSRKTRLTLAGPIVLALFGALLSAKWPVMLGKLGTDISVGAFETWNQGALAVAQLGVVYLLTECCSVLRRTLLDCIIAAHEADLQENMVEKLLKMPAAYYASCASGERTAQMNQGVAGLSQLIKTLCSDVLAAVLVAVCTIAQVVLNAPGLLAVVVLLYLLSSVAISVLQIRSQNGIRETIVGQKNALNGQICQSIANLELIRSMSAEQHERKRLRPVIVGVSKSERKHHRDMGVFDCLKQAVKVGFQVVLLLLSLLLTLKGEMAAGSVMTVYLLFQQLIKPIDEIYRFMDETASSMVKAKGLLEVIACKQDEVFDRKSSGEGLSNRFIQLKGVLITNPEKDKPLAKYPRLTIPCAKKVALQGASGAGKTTLIRCLTRYYPYVEGEVMLFGRSIESYSQQELTSLLYYTPQSTFFFSGTIRENLLYGLDSPPPDEVLLDALDKARLVGDYEGAVCRTPEDALDYLVNEGAANLSGGQRQRLSLARAFLCRPKLYIFDESTANLDEHTANAVLTNLERHAAACEAGIIYISHDKRVLERCDEVITVGSQTAGRTTGREAA